MISGMKARLVALFASAACASGGLAQQPMDPTPALGALISAFQNCGPAGTYQMLSPLLYNILAAQTGGRGCYADIAAAGPVIGMQVMGRQDFPIGPLFVVRVRHQSGATADWFIGFNLMAQKVEYLRYQAAAPTAPPPSIQSGPSISSKGPSTSDPTPPPENPPTGTGGKGGGEGCDLYPAMCG